MSDLIAQSFVFHSLQGCCTIHSGSDHHRTLRVHSTSPQFHENDCLESACDVNAVNISSSNKANISQTIHSSFLTKHSTTSKADVECKRENASIHSPMSWVSTFANHKNTFISCPNISTYLQLPKLQRDRIFDLGQESKTFDMQPRSSFMEEYCISANEEFPTIATPILQHAPALSMQIDVDHRNLSAAPKSPTSVPYSSLASKYCPGVSIVTVHSPQPLQIFPSILHAAFSGENVIAKLEHYYEQQHHMSKKNQHRSHQFQSSTNSDTMETPSMTTTGCMLYALERVGILAGLVSLVRF
jgi:hypothetical protein